MASKAVYSAIFLAMTMIVLAVFYIAQDALFLGVVQVVVYTGAVMMLFLFVMMLIGIDTAESLVETIRGQRIADGPGRAGLRCAADRRHRHRVDSVHRSGPSQCGRQRRRIGGADLHPLPVGVRGHQRAADHRRARRDGAGPPGTLRPPQDPTRTVPRTLRCRRAAHSRCPVPGVYARHNAVDIPALLPDGSYAEVSVSKILTPRTMDLTGNGSGSGTAEGNGR